MAQARSVAHVDDDPNGAASYRDFGRTFLRVGDPFTPLAEIVQHGVFVETTEEIDLVDMDEDARAAHDRKTESWELLWRTLSPSFRQEMIALAKKSKLRRKVCAEINGGLVGARGEDANTFKKYIGYHILEDPKAVVDPPIFPGIKTDRGFNHPTIATLLLPLKHEPTPETFDRISRRKILITANDFPRFMFKSDAVYNKDDVEEGILEGHLPFRMAKVNMQGPAAALKAAGARRGNRGNAARMHVLRFTPRLVAYIVVQTYFALSSLESWQEVHDRFDYRKFYWNIVGLFDDGANTHILELFNYHVFGDKAGKVGSDDAPQSDAEEEESDILRLKAQRAAKRAHLTAATAAPAPASES
ncbi:hypothetical protein C8R46DRAFT_1303853 [Mycena filopes]|nr:hypothetical protein C8R46DRAFT_1303853 [Mycena filopes]